MQEWRRAFPIVLATSLFWLAVFAVIFLLDRRHPAAQPIEILPPSVAAPQATVAATATPAPLRVYVSGAVHSPGVYRLPPNSIVDEALQAAGGTTEQADLRLLNLAHPLQDGDQIFVPTQGEAPAIIPLSQEIQSQAGDKSSAVGHPIDLNTASATELESLPGVGPKTAQAIIEQRPYSSVDDLLRVKGIGEKTLEKLRPYIKVE